MVQDGGDGMATVQLDADEEAQLSAMKIRTLSDPTSDPTTGADLGAGLKPKPDL